MLPRLAMTLSAFCLASVATVAEADGFTLEQGLSYPYPSELTAAPRGSALAWVQNEAGVRNVWVADDAGATPRQLTHYSADDGQEITQLSFSSDGTYLLFVRGGDHDANWPVSQEPNPDASTQKPEVQIWSINLKDGSQVLVSDGDEPAISPDSTRLVFIHDHAVWWAPLNGGKAQALFFDRGRASELAWSPDGKALAFVSGRDDHSFIGIYRDDKMPIQYLSPSTNHDFMPRWSLDGSRVAFVRVPGDGGAPQPLLKRVPNPWSIWVAAADTGKATLVWQSPKTLHGSYPETEGEANLHWLAGDKLLFLADLDNWPHLYSVSAQGGQPRLLTPGKFMVEYLSVAADGSRVVYSANTGAQAEDQDRCHLYVLTADGSAPPKALTSGDTSEWTPKLVGDGKTLGFILAHVQTPPLVMAGSLDKADWRPLDQDRIPATFPSSGFVTPKSVTFKAADGLMVHGQLFAADGAAGKKPGIIFVHGGPPRQMLLSWHYMGYYSNAYAVNQFLASHGFIVLSVNYRLGIGYGHDYNHPDHWGPTGAAEYQDVVAGARFLQRDARVDAKRIGIWGGSYGGYLTAMGLARNSDIFKAGVDFHGVHDWSYDISEVYTGGKPRYEQGDRKQAQKIAFDSSPVASMKTWRSPVLLIQGDDDRNVYFNETIDMANRLQERGVHYEELVFPNEIHGFLRHASWLTADAATVEFFQRQLQPMGD